MSVIIEPFVNFKGERRFRILATSGKLLLDCFGNGYFTPRSALRGLYLFTKWRKDGNKDKI